MKSAKRFKGTLAVLLACMMVLVAACSNNGTNNQEGAAAPPSGEENTGNAAATPPADPMAKYDPPIELTTVAFQMENPVYPQGDDIDHNVWRREYEAQLGIKVKNLWVASSSPEVRDQKMSVAIASGNLPDIMDV
ncbi:ABC transporter substrate-binding protein, partial [Paenibacillus sepulcri]|nr:ABC transporter substrate-binding protein [Paenibacillus sepulcri]